MIPVTKVGTASPFKRGDPFFQTTPDAIDAHVSALCIHLGVPTAAFVPVEPAPYAENGFCQDNVAKQIERHGGSSALGWAIWANELFIMAEFHSVWISTTGRMIDITPAAEGERSILFAVDANYPPDFDFWNRPGNVAIRTIERATPQQVDEMIAALSPARRSYEERRAAGRGIDLATHMADKAESSELATAVDELIACCAQRDRIVVRTVSKLFSPDPEQFMKFQSRIADLQTRIERLLVGPVPSRAP